MLISRNRAQAVGLAVLTGTAIAVASATPALAATWSVVPTPAVASPFNGIDALSTSSAWAVGRGRLAARWNGGTWSVVNTPTVAGEFSGVDGSSTSNVWAVGSREVPLGGGTVTSGTLTERWNGTSWSVVPTPDAGRARSAPRCRA